MLTFIARPDIVIYPFAEFFPVEVSFDQFNGFFLSKVSRYLGVVTSFSDLGQPFFF